MQVGNGGSGSLGSVNDNGLLIFNLSGNPSYSGVISGSGSLVQAGTGTLTLTNSSLFTGLTTIANGSLLLSNSNALQNSTVQVNGNSLLFNSAIPTFNVGGLTGGGNIVLSDGGSLTLSVGGNVASTTYNGVLSGTGGLTKAAGSGICPRRYNNTYSGSTTLAAGELSISTSSNLSPNSSGRVQRRDPADHRNGPSPAWRATRSIGLRSMAALTSPMRPTCLP